MSGRPPLWPPRNQRIGIRLTEEERAILSQEDGRPSTVINRLIQNYCKRKKREEKKHGN